MKNSNAFDRILQRVKPENKQFIDKNLAIAQQVRAILKSHPTIKTQKALAQALEKEESEICKWLSGRHNITLESITKMEVVLGQDIILTTDKAKQKYQFVSTDEAYLHEGKQMIGILADVNLVVADFQYDEKISHMVSDLQNEYKRLKNESWQPMKSVPQKRKNASDKEIAF